MICKRRPVLSNKLHIRAILIIDNFKWRLALVPTEREITRVAGIRHKKLNKLHETCKLICQENSGIVTETGEKSQ